MSELEHIPTNRWNRAEYERLKAFTQKVEKIIQDNEDEHKDWCERYHIKHSFKKGEHDGPIIKKPIA